jgi:hypothetical protein
MAMHLQARRYEDLPKEIALIELRKDMRQKVPCIGECVMFDAKTSKKKSIKRKLSIQDLLEKRTRFPTVVIPFGRDGSKSHSFVDLIFDSTQPSALKLCRGSLDWICGNDGMGLIDVAMRFKCRSWNQGKAVTQGDEKLVTVLHMHVEEEPILMVQP